MLRLLRELPGRVAPRPIEATGSESFWPTDLGSPPTAQQWHCSTRVAGNLLPILQAAGINPAAPSVICLLLCSSMVSQLTLLEYIAKYICMILINIYDRRLISDFKIL